MADEDAPDGEPTRPLAPAPPRRHHDAPDPTGRAPSGAPNVVVVLIDDMGFGASTPYGGPCEMPTAERLADEGLRYSRFHVTALCSPTRQALMTGRNHHSVGMGVTSEMSTPEPGYHGFRPASAATIAQILGGNGYSTAAFGKWHQTPPVEVSPSGPFTRWPTGEGFDHFYGFMGAEMNHWYPQLYEGRHPVEPDRLPEDGYHLTEDLVDHAIDWVRTSRRSRRTGRSSPTSPSARRTRRSTSRRSGGTSTPAASTRGWDAQREQTLARQKELGIVPEQPSSRPGPRACRTGTSSTRPSAGSRPGSWRPTPGSPSTPTSRSGGSSTRSTTSASSTTPCSSTCSGDNGASGEGGPRGTFREHLVGHGSPGRHRRHGGPARRRSATPRRTRSTRSAGRWR